MIKRLALAILVLFVFSTLAFSLPALTTSGKNILSGGSPIILRGLSMVSVWNMGTRNGPRYSFYSATYPTETPDNCIKALIDLSVDPAMGWYAKVIRLPVYPTTQDADPGWNDAAQRTENNRRIQLAVDYCTAKGVYVILDWHYIANYGDKLATTQAFWDWAAPNFKNNPNVIFEIFNEPIYDNDTNKSISWTTWKTTIAQPIVDRIRTTHSATNLILCGSPNWSQTVAPIAASPLTGANIAYVAHIYPYHYDLDNPSGGTYVGSLIGTTKDTLPVFFTEWGFQQGAAMPCDGANEDNYASGMKAYFEANGISWTGWCFDPYWQPVCFNNWDFLGLMGGSLPTTGGYQGKFLQDYLAQFGGGGGTAAPTQAPTAVPTAAPTQGPTSAPTAVPTVAPTGAPTSTPAPTAVPTATPAGTAAPTTAPTAVPTVAPTVAPTAVPTTAPTAPPGGCTTITATSVAFNTTAAYCFQTQYQIAGWGASNASDRTVSVTVNGTGTAVTVVGAALPAKLSTDYYVFQWSAGSMSYAACNWW